MGGGQKRGRTQRRHFKQSRDNVWKHNNNPKKTRPVDEANNDDPNSNPNPNPNPNTKWEPFISQNTGFEEYYKEQGIVPEEEWEEFMCLLRKPLPAAFRINSSGQFSQDIRLQLENDFMKSLEAEANNENESEAIRPLPWYPDNLAWHLNFSRMQLRKNQTLERFHEFLKQENEVGNITRQEAVSMVPPLFLDVLPHHHVLDMCAAPGSKTFQLLEIIHQSKEPGLLPDGLVIANDVDVQRCNLLIHQTKRMCSANLIVTNHEAQHFPSCSLTKGCIEFSKVGQQELGKSSSALQFDRVLCDVPCSGDGTLRKAPDIWRKWNAGMGNGVHRLQVEIAMRGLALLKVGGRMVYSTCSMNPVENEAVVAEVLRRSKGSVELLDVSNELPEFVRRQGLRTWKVRDRGLWLASFKNVPKYRRSVILPSMFPSDEGCTKEASCDTMQDDFMALDSDVGRESLSGSTTQPSSDMAHERNGENLKNKGTAAADDKAAGQIGEVSIGTAFVEVMESDFKVEVSKFPLERCMRIVPHDQNTGAFFISVLQKTSLLKEDYNNQPSNSISKSPANMNDSLTDNHQSEISLFEDVPDGQPPSVTEETSDASLIDESLLAASTKDGLVSGSMDVGSEDIEEKDPEECENGEKGHVEIKGRKGRLLTQGKWKGVDPVVFFKDEATINSILSFYGISESFPLDGHLVTRNNDANHVKRIYYISKSVHDTLRLNFQAGQRLKITSLGLKIFERQGSKEGSSPCLFRLSSEGLPLLLPYITKQILCASLADFRHLLQYRTIKFADFVDAKFGEMASELMLGCCVVVLGEGKRSPDTIQMDASTIAMVCWKGRTNLCIMVSQLDGQELLERLSIRFGCEKSATQDEMNRNLVTGEAENPEDQELGEPNADGEQLGKSEAATHQTVTN